MSNEPTGKAGTSRRGMLKMTGAGLAGAGLSGVAGSLLSTLPANARAAAAYEVPDEALPHTRIWMAWPASTTIWGRSLLPRIQADIATLARTIAKYETITMIADGSTNAANARAAIGSTIYPVTVLSTIPNDDCWMRDMGAVFRRNGAGGLDTIGLKFNAWGNKQTHAKDALVAQRMASYLSLPFTTGSVVGEGGGVIEDGDGTLIANLSSWVNSNRNPGKSQAQVEAQLLSLYGAQKMIWCQGIKGQDITDDHIDATAQFVAPGQLVIHNPPAGATDIWSVDARKVYDVLSKATDAKGRRFQITLLNQPVHTRSRNPDMLLSYINYLVVNGAVIDVNFGDAATDADTQAKLASLYPGRVVEMINLDNLYGNGGGGIHCVTQQQPLA